MADPRVNIVKPCPPAYLGRSSAEIGQGTATRRNFFNAAGKIGDLEVLNSVGAGKIGEGLRTLASVSNSIRTGCGSLPTSIGGALGAVADTADAAFTAGTDWALQQMGMDTTTVDAVRAFNPGIANQAYGQAQQIYDRVRQGTFKYTDIPSYLQDFQNLERLGRNIFTPSATDRNNSLQPQCEASPYAIDLIARAPKHKFMFVVQFVPAPAYQSISALDIAFVVHESSRPNIRYQMEDVNFYNFRSKIVTRTEFEPMSMKFYDDILNNAGRFHAALLKALTPVANYSSRGQFDMPEEEGMAYFASTATAAIEDFGFAGQLDDIGAPSTLGGGNTSGPATIDGVSFTPTVYSASHGPLLEESKTLFREINLFHLFDGGRLMNVYSFYNPRFTDLKLDDLSMAESTATSVELSFAYDTCYIDTNVSFQNGKLARSAQSASAGVGGSSIYSLRYISSPEAATGPNNAGIAPLGTPVSATNDCGPVDTNNPNATSGQASPPAQQSPDDTFSA